MIEKVCDAIDAMAAQPAEVGVNVSLQSVADPGFRAGLRDLLSSHPQVAKKLVIEIAGYAASRSPQLTGEFAQELHELGARIAIDNFDLDANSVAIAHALLPIPHKDDSNWGYAWIPVVGPIIGGVIAGVLANLYI